MLRGIPIATLENRAWFLSSDSGLCEASCMADPKQTSARVVAHGNGVGVPSPDDVEKRAREIAVIEGREEPIQVDREQARMELTGQGADESLAESWEALEANQEIERDTGATAGSIGGRIEPVEAHDEQTALEEEVREGVEEAHHEQAYEANREEE